MSATPIPVNYSASLGSMVLAAFDYLPASVTTIPIESTHLGTAVLTMLHQAEKMAAAAGLSKVERGPDGGAYLVIGSAMAKIRSAPEPVRTIYLAAQRAAFEVSKPADVSMSTPADFRFTSQKLPVSAAFPVVPVAIAVGVVAIAAWGIARAGQRLVEVSGDHVRQIAIANRAAELQQRGTPPDAPSWEILKRLAAKEIPSESALEGPGMLVAGLTVVALAGAWLFWRRT